jgi:tetratricopeptide (TPR) repeat protein
MIKIFKTILVGCVVSQFTLVSCSSSNKIRCPDILQYAVRNNETQALEYGSDKEGAIDTFTCLINRSPNNAELYIERGWLRNEVGNKYGAIDDFNIGIDKQIALIDLQLEDEKKGVAKSNDGSWRMKRELGHIYYRRAIVKSDLGDKSGTINDFQSAAQIYSSIGNTEWYQKSLQAVETAKNR